MSEKKFTFKTEKPTGPWKSFEPTFYYIKLDKKEVGQIGDKKPHRIRLTVIKKDILEDGNPNCDWKWITLKKESSSIEEAKEFLNASISSIMEKYDLKKLD